jgi:hypothetical protein
MSYVKGYEPLGGGATTISARTQCRRLTGEQKELLLRDLLASADNYKILADLGSVGAQMEIKKGGSGESLSRVHALARHGPEIANDLLCALRQLAVEHGQISELERKCRVRREELEKTAAKLTGVV